MGCRLKMIVHCGMTLVDPLKEGEIFSLLEKDIGNVVASSTSSFEFKIRTDADAKKIEEKFLPFQVQTWFSLLDGSRYLRVQTLQQEVTHKREEAEEHLDVNIVASNAMQQAGDYASSGRYGKARERMVVQQKMMARQPAMSSPAPANPMYAQNQQAGYSKFVENAQQLDDALLE